MTISPIALGATLYVPAGRTDLAASLFGDRRPAGLRSAVVCLEDSVREDGLAAAMSNVAALLRAAPPLGADGGRPLVFVRPRDPDVLNRVLLMPGAERLAGFVLPKIHAGNLPDFLARPFHEAHLLMPTLETREAFDPAEVGRLREQLSAVRERVLALRIGGNDLLQCLGLRRERGAISYEGPLGPIIAGLSAAFAPWGFALTAPVMEQFDDPALLMRETLRDVAHGLLSKTAIHPSQIAPIQGALAVPSDLADEARRILDPASPAVFARDGAMCEPATHRVWAERLLEREAAFGRMDGRLPARRA